MRPRDLDVSARDLRRWGWLLVALLSLLLGTSSAAAHATSTVAINVGESSYEQLAHGARVYGYDDRAQQVQRSPAAPHLVLRLRDAPLPPVVGSAAQPSLWPSSGVAAEAVPARLARVTEARFAGSPSLGPPGAGRVFVTAADDIQGITTSQGLAHRLTLLDDAGKLREGPFSVTAFDTPAEGLGVPAFRSNPGFVQGGFTGGGAREFDLPNLLYGDLGNVAQWIVP